MRASPHPDNQEFIDDGCDVCEEPVLLLNRSMGVLTVVDRHDRSARPIFEISMVRAKDVECHVIFECKWDSQDRFPLY
jgi:hypothetical protein